MSRQSSRVRSSVVPFLAILFAFCLFLPGQAALAQDAQTVTVDIPEEDGSGVTGTAVLTADGDQTIFDLELVGGEAGYEGHIFDNTCDNHQGATVFYAIEPVDETLTSQSILDVSFDEITNGTYWIHVHKPGGERGIGVGCGQIEAYSGVGGALPNSGVGMPGSGASFTLLLSAVVAAAGLFAVAMQLRKSEDRR
jgi:hypothetical protein